MDHNRSSCLIIVIGGCLFLLIGSCLDPLLPNLNSGPVMCLASFASFVLLLACIMLVAVLAYVPRRMADAINDGLIERQEREGFKRTLILYSIKPTESNVDVLKRAPTLADALFRLLGTGALVPLQKLLESTPPLITETTEIPYEEYELTVDPDDPNVWIDPAGGSPRLSDYIRRVTRYETTRIQKTNPDYTRIQEIIRQIETQETIHQKSDIA